uniref:Minor capsid protein P9 transmembrane helices domain-containing protein n=1 Tax=Mimivirus LCMiAC01 TaxID=2506608 RepID=A0A481YZW8_9VIRU|nr:MAG: uncharacterized protein LCMiAC01_00490 [Mimivirus LCMiAC01]
MSILSYNDEINNFNLTSGREHFWMDNYKDLYQNKNYIKFLPKYDTTRNEQLNAITRLCIYIILLILIFTKNTKWLYLPITIIVLVVIFHNVKKIDENSQHKKLNKLMKIRKLKQGLRRRDITTQYKHDGSSKLDYDVLFTDEEDEYVKNYNIKANKINFDEEMYGGSKYSAFTHEPDYPPNTTQEIEQFKQNTCRLPTKDNPFMNPDLTEFNAGDIPVACNANDEDINEQTKVFYNHDLFRDIDELWEKKNSQRQFYTVPNTTVPNNQVEFAKFLYSTGPTCFESQGACLRYEDLRFKR